MSKARELAELGAVYDSGALANRNMIINGAMQVSQRSTAAHNEGTGYFALDRWRQEKANQDQFTYSVEQVSDGPSGFSKCLRVTTSTAETALASDEFGRIQQIIEGNNLERIGFGTTDAKPFTLSFYVKSSVTGNYAVSFYVADANVIYNKAYTINTANTWEYKTLTFPAYTTAGPTIDNTAGLTLNFGLFAGSAKTTVTTNWTSYTQAYLFGGQTANLAATLNDSWRITGIQLEVGTEATPFEHRSFGDELHRCQRYFEVIVSGNSKDIGGGNYYSSSSIHCPTIFETSKRTDSYSVTVTGGSSYFRVYRDGTSDDFNGFTGSTRHNINRCLLYATSNVSGTAGHGLELLTNNASAKVVIDDEL
jgi:hypothetical protein